MANPSPIIKGYLTTPVLNKPKPFVSVFTESSISFTSELTSVCPLTFCKTFCAFPVRCLKISHLGLGGMSVMPIRRIIAGINPTANMAFQSPLAEKMLSTP
jgi:hypothetical protein